MKKYNGVLVSDLLENGRKFGFFSITSSQIIFTKDVIEVPIPLGGLELTFGGAGNRLIYFKHPNLPEYTLHTDDYSVLDHPEIQYLNSKVSKKTVYSTRLYLAGMIGFSLLMIAVIIVAFYAFRSTIIKQIALQLPMSYQESIGKPLFESHLKSEKVLKSDTIDQYLVQLTNPLIKQLNDSSYHFRFAVIDNQDINAFALPGGYVVINSGLLLKADSPDEVAGVLAHEISHVVHRHHLRGVFNQIGSFYLLSMFFGDISAIGNLIDIGSNLEKLNFSREFETESDIEGLKLALASGYSAEGFTTFFKKLQKEHGESNSFLAYLSTHPDSGNRIAEIEKEASKIQVIGKKPEFFISFSTFKQHLNTFLNK